MQNTRSNKLLRNGILLSLLLHLLIFLSMTRVIFFEAEPAPVEHQNYVPAYTTASATAPPMQAQVAQPIQSTLNYTRQAQKQAVSDNKPEKSYANSPHGIYHQSVLAMSRDILQQNQFAAAINHNRNAAPMLLIGDSSRPSDPIVEAIGRSLSAHFNYPRMEGSFGVKGRVLVEMVLHPEGYYTDVQIVQSSNNSNFDAAALYAVNTAPRVVGIDKVLTKPMDFVVGFIFD